MGQAKWGGALLALLALAVAGCPKQTAGPAVSEYQKQRAEIIEKAKQQGGAPAATVAGQPKPGSSEPSATAFGATGAYAYDPAGKRDPFRSFILDRIKERDKESKGPLEQFDLSQLTVTGVVWDTDKRRALVLDPSGQNYIVQEGDPIGKNDGRIISIGDNSLVVKEAYVDFHGEKTTKEIEMRVRQSQGG
jgi:type IV pilus assembly protein PilP